MQKIPVFHWPLILVGALCALFPAYLTKALPYLLGAVMVLIGIEKIRYWNREPKRWESSNEFSVGIILLIVGVSFLVQGSQALLPMGITWEILGIRQASKSLTCLLRAIEAHEPKWHFLLEFMIRIVLALILLFNPCDKFAPHLRLLGIELMIEYLPLADFIHKHPSSKE